MQNRGGMNGHGGHVNHLGHARHYSQQQCHPQQQGPLNNWATTTQFVNRAKQAALQQSGNHQLAALFANHTGGSAVGGGGGGGGASASYDGFMRPPVPGVRMGAAAPPQSQPVGGGKAACQCANCTTENQFQGYRPFTSGMDETQQPRGGVMRFTSQLTGLPIPEHPSGLFPSVDFVMVPAGENVGCECGCGQNMMSAFVGGPHPQAQPPPPVLHSRPQQQQYGWNGPPDNGGARYYGGGNNMPTNCLF